MILQSSCQNPLGETGSCHQESQVKIVQSIIVSEHSPSRDLSDEILNIQTGMESLSSNLGYEKQKSLNKQNYFQRNERRFEQYIWQA